MMERPGIAVCLDCAMLMRQTRWACQGAIRSPLVQSWSRRSFAVSAPPSTQATGRKSRESAHRRAQIVRNASAATRPRIEGNSAGPNNTNALHNRVVELTASALKPADQVIPSEQRVLYVLEQLDAITKSLLVKNAPTAAGAGVKQEPTATSALLGSVNAKKSAGSISKTALLDSISLKAEEIARSPKVFLTPAILRSYVDLQSALQQPSSLPDVLELYANKPTPTVVENAVKYTPVSPGKVNTAIDVTTANTALASAMEAHNLPLCMDIIANTFCTPAFKKAKLIRQALVPASLVAAAPLVAYGLSKQFGLLQSAVDPTYATSVAFAGIMTYVGTVCSLGYIVITTSNDQMDRVTWAQGVPLWERWLREDERAALDRVASKWGFQSIYKRGDEEGQEWESLREHLGMRGMVLDRVELMEGMQ